MAEKDGDILGVDRQLVERFLILFRDHYREVDKATIFLEQSEGISNGQSFVNVRDALSHLVTALHQDTPTEKRAEQLPTCEEHLRRAILEPYETTLSARLEKLKPLVEEYKRGVLPRADSSPDFRDAPNEVRIEAVRAEIGQLAAKGRAAKAKNLWNSEWREGVKAFAEAYERARNIFAELEKHHYRFLAIQRRRQEILIAVIIGVIGITATIIVWLLR